MKLITFKDSFFFTRAGAIIPRLSCILSALSSALIISIILRSDAKLNNSYHRIMFVMSFWDIVSSSAMSFTTILLPADVQSVYPFESKSYGTAATCEAQGFAYQVGAQFVIFSSILLHIYYACTIRYKVSKAFFATFIEPLFFIFSVPLCFLIPVLAIVYGRINPVPYEPFCSNGPYPWTCTVVEDVTCIRGGNVPRQLNSLLKHFFLGLIMTALVITITIMIIIIRKVKRGERKLRNGQRRNSLESNEKKPDSQFPIPTTVREKNSENQTWRANDDNENINIEIDHHKGQENGNDVFIPSDNEIESTALTAKAIIVQAYMYVGAFLLTFTFVVLSFLMPQTKAIHILKLIFQPLQGFFNCIIFIFDKAQHVRSNDPQLTWKEAVRSAILEPDKYQDLILSQIEIVEGNRRQSSTPTSPDKKSPRKINRRGLFLSQNNTANVPSVTRECLRRVDGIEYNEEERHGERGVVKTSDKLSSLKTVQELENGASDEVIPLANLNSLIIMKTDSDMVNDESDGSHIEVDTLQDDLDGFIFSNANIESFSTEGSANIRNSLRSLCNKDNGEVEAPMATGNASTNDCRPNDEVLK